MNKDTVSIITSVMAILFLQMAKSKIKDSNQKHSVDETLDSGIEKGSQISSKHRSPNQKRIDHKTKNKCQNQSIIQSLQDTQGSKHKYRSQSSSLKPQSNSKKTGRSLSNFIPKSCSTLIKKKNNVKRLGQSSKSSHRKPLGPTFVRHGSFQPTHDSDSSEKVEDAEEGFETNQEPEQSPSGQTDDSSSQESAHLIVDESPAANAGSEEPIEDSTSTSTRITLKKRFAKAMRKNQQLAKANEDLRKKLTSNTANISTQPSQSWVDNNDLLRTLQASIINRQNPIAVSALTPCAAQDGGDIQITDWECWKRRFEAWLTASNVSCPATKQVFFDIYAGDKLTLALITAPEMLDTEATGYDLTVKKLDSVFKSRSSSFAMKRDFRAMTQKTGESNVAFLSRLMTAAMRIWDRADSQIDDEIMLTMTVNSNNLKMQEFAMKTNQDGSAQKCKYEDLVRHARLVDNMAHFKDTSESRVLAVNESSYVPKPKYIANEDGRSRFSSSGRSQGSRSNSHGSSKQMITECRRCGATDHSHYNCRFINERCFFCNIKGHVIDVCRKRQRAIEQDKANQQKKHRNSEICEVEKVQAQTETEEAKVTQDKA